MKKRFLVLVGLFCLFILFTSCDNKINNSAKLSISPREFTEESKQVMQFLGGNVNLWDVKLNDEIKSYEFKMLFFEDGKWQECSGKHNFDNDDKQNKKKLSIGISEMNNKFSLLNIDDNGYGRFGGDKIIDFSKMTLTTTHQINKEEFVEKNKEIVVYSKYAYKGEKSSWSTSDYDKAFDKLDVDCDKAVVVTLTLYDKMIKDKK